MEHIMSYVQSIAIIIFFVEYAPWFSSFYENMLYVKVIVCISYWTNWLHSILKIYLGFKGSNKASIYPECLIRV